MTNETMIDPDIEEAAGAATVAAEPGREDGPGAPHPDPTAADPSAAAADPSPEPEAVADPAPADPAPDDPSAGTPAVIPTDEAPAESAGDALLAAVGRLEAHVTAEAGRILQSFTEKLAFDGFKEEQVARLHAELQQHREGMLERATRPLLNAVIRVHDDLGKVVASLRARPAEEVTPERAFRALDGFRDDLELLLSQHGVEPFEPVDDAFDPRLHTALRTVPTDHPERAGRIAERLRPGFSHGGALLQKARVAVYTAQGARPSAAPTDTPANGEPR
jgi:molecular chaperone GrpE